MKSVSSIQMSLPTGPTTESEVVGPVGFIHLYSSKLDFFYSLTTLPKAKWFFEC